MVRAREAIVRTREGRFFLESGTERARLLIPRGIAIPSWSLKVGRLARSRVRSIGRGVIPPVSRFRVRARSDDILEFPGNLFLSRRTRVSLADDNRSAAASRLR